MPKISTFFNAAAAKATLLSATVISAIGNMALADTAGSPWGALLSLLVLLWGGALVYKAEKNPMQNTVFLPKGNRGPITSLKVLKTTFTRPSFLATATALATLPSLGESFADVVGIKESGHSLSYEITNFVAWAATITGNVVQVIADRVNKEKRDYKFLRTPKPWHSLAVNPVYPYAISGPAFAWQHAFKTDMSLWIPASATILFFTGLGYDAYRAHQKKRGKIEQNTKNGVSNAFSAAARIVVAIGAFIVTRDFSYTFSQFCFGGSAARQGVEARKALKLNNQMPKEFNYFNLIDDSSYSFEGQGYQFMNTERDSVKQPFRFYPPYEHV